MSGQPPPLAGIQARGKDRMAENPVEAAVHEVPFVSRAGETGWHLLVRVQPGARKSEYAGVLDGRLRIRLAAPAVENKANKALCAFVAKTLGLKTSKVTLVSGETGRQKRLFIEAPQEPDWGLLEP